MGSVDGEFLCSSILIYDVKRGDWDAFDQFGVLALPMSLDSYRVRGCDMLRALEGFQYTIVEGVGRLMGPSYSTECRPAQSQNDP